MLLSVSDMQRHMVDEVYIPGIVEQLVGLVTDAAAVADAAGAPMHECVTRSLLHSVGCASADELLPLLFHSLSHALRSNADAGTTAASCASEPDGESSIPPAPPKRRRKAARRAPQR